MGPASGSPKAARSESPELPIMLQSLTSDYQAEAKALPSLFVHVERFA